MTHVTPCDSLLLTLSIKVPWAECERYILKCLLKVWVGWVWGISAGVGLSDCPSLPLTPPSLIHTFHTSPPRPQVVRGRFTNIGLVSALVGGLAQMHDSLGIAFVDQV